ncbi:syntaxin-71 [Anaeramoeba flamelloides]|uniref:Syntaxin-71 n=1 Tax=Anaeramoeba flamelloides TaxID=1746091 RepID=A0ABQ8Z392_9EUKA|nr:syntaxin-71 [Anaeramoeba flamelloides]
MEDLIKRVEHIQEMTGDNKIFPDENEETETGFDRVRREIRSQIHSVKEEIHERDQMRKKKSDSNRANIAKINYSIRKKLSKIRDDSERLDELKETEYEDSQKYSRKERKQRKKNPDWAEQQDNELEELQEKRDEFINSILNDLEEVDKRFSITFEPKQLRREAINLQETKKNIQIDLNKKLDGEDENEEIGERMKQIRLNKEEIDQDLSEIGEGAMELKEMAIQMGETLDTQNEMLVTIEDKMENVQEHLDNVNRKLKKAVDSVRSGDKFCIDFVLILILLGIIAYISKLIFN